MSSSSINEDEEISKIANDLQDISEKSNEIYNILAKMKDLLNISMQLHINISNVYNVDENYNKLIDNVYNECKKDLLKNRDECKAYIIDFYNKVNEMYRDIKNFILKELLKSIGFDIKISSEISDDKLKNMITKVSELDDIDKDIFKDTFKDKLFENNVEEISELIDTYYINFVYRGYGTGVKFSLDANIKRLLFKIISYTGKLNDINLFLKHIVDKQYIELLKKFNDNIKNYKNEAKNSAVTEDNLLQQYTINGITDLDNLFSDLNEINDGINAFINCHKKLPDLEKILTRLGSIKLSYVQLIQDNDRLTKEISEKVNECKKYEQINSIKDFINAKKELEDFETSIREVLKSIFSTINDLYTSITKLQQIISLNCTKNITEIKKYLSEMNLDASICKQIDIYLKYISDIDNILNNCIKDLVNMKSLDLDLSTVNYNIIIPALSELSKKVNLKIKLKIEVENNGQ